MLFASELFFAGTRLALIAALASPSPAPQPDSTPASEQPSTPSSNAPVEDEYNEQAARVDLETVATGSGRDYLDARARLEANPELSRRILHDELHVLDTMAEKILAKGEIGIGRGSAQDAQLVTRQRRLTALLAALGGRDDTAHFARKLRQAWLSAPEDHNFDCFDTANSANYWCSLLSERGSEATAELKALLADREMPTPARLALITALVRIANASQLGELAAAVGLGDEALERSLRRQLHARGLRTDADRNQLLAVYDQRLDQAQGTELAKLIQARSALAPKDADFAQRLRDWGQDAGRDFAVRVAALRGLESDTPDNQKLFSNIARSYAKPSRTQAEEILATIALERVSDATAQSIIAEHKLLLDASPRLATIAFDRARMDNKKQSGRAWLRQSQANPWPSVRSAALRRIEAPCDRRSLAYLSQLAGPLSRGGDPTRAVQRAAMEALGRCGGDQALESLLALIDDNAIEHAARGDAARIAIELAGAPAMAYTARLAALSKDPRLSSSLLLGLREAHQRRPVEVGSTSPELAEVVTALCSLAHAEDFERAPAGGEMAARSARSEARTTLQLLFPEQSCPESGKSGRNK